MPACEQCGKDNPEGTAFCGYCATPLPQFSKAGIKLSSPQIRGGSPPPKPSKAELRTPTFQAAAPSGGGKGNAGFELIPWSELSPGQRAGRIAAAVVVLLLISFFLRGILRSLVGSRASSEPAPVADGANAPITDGDRRDGIESLCKVFQIYGLPKNDSGATEAVHNAAELFKLAGNQSPERSTYILTSIVGEFRAGQLGETDCAQAGAPIPTNPAESPDNSGPDNSSPGTQPGSNQ
jgi:hypothetical protein